MRRIACIAAFLAATAFTREAAQAQLVFTLFQPTSTGAPGSIIHFGGTLTNPLGTSLFLNGDAWSISATILTVNDTPFLLNAPLFLGPGGVYSGPLFDIGIAAAAAPGLYSGTFTILGGTSPGVSNPIASQPFAVTVSTSVAPEPSSFALMLTALLSLSVVGWVRGSRVKRSVILAG